MTRIIYELPGLRLTLGVSRGRSCVMGGAGWVEASIGLDVVEADVEESLLGELLASLLLLEPAGIEGDVEAYRLLVSKYLGRVFGEEAGRLRRLLARSFERLYVADIYPAVARMSRLQRIYPWLRIAYSAALQRSSYYSWLRRLLRETVLAGVDTHSRWIPAKLIASKGKSHPLINRLGEAARAIGVLGSFAQQAFLPLLRALPQSLLMESIGQKPHPLTSDPLLLARLDSARLATKLVSFEDQLYAITGVKRLLDSLKLRRKSIVRSVLVLGTGDFKPAVVKRYIDLSAVKWIVASVASLPLPKPRLRPLARLDAEYYYNRLLAEKGFHVPHPLLVDPRRRLAAYSYIEGSDLIALLQRDPAPEPYREAGRLLARLHRSGVALWDANPGNFVYDGENLYLVDLEQARGLRGIGEAAWDIAMASYYSLIYAPRSGPERAAMIASGYLEAGGGREVLLEAAKYKYMAPFLAAAPPNLLERTRRALLAAAQGNQP
ncbi:hypothetical protein CF15_04230 [Pyrodictium occultum]|uniref:Aminoglycoside phosphotransferase domain-containing protein n=1 Tax=Pyrodictium occultum TaxID=2309 RepID=A0A0V8RVC2_PYROC|nr:hypothetical protein CF15_04230 [Pyrodictium occultum]